ncbi:unnamed protein product, partial [Nesidiocoris tenuis]
MARTICRGARLGFVDSTRKLEILFSETAIRGSVSIGHQQSIISQFSLFGQSHNSEVSNDPLRMETEMDFKDARGSTMDSAMWRNNSYNFSRLILAVNQRNGKQAKLPSNPTAFCQNVHETPTTYRSGDLDLQDRKTSLISPIRHTHQSNANQARYFIAYPLIRVGVGFTKSKWKYCDRPKIENRNGASEKTFSYTHLLRITSRTS